jgi:prephenate dehydrogenase
MKLNSATDPRGADEPFERLAVLGLGLLGGSLAMAARGRGLAKHVVGAGRRLGPLEFAKDRGIIDSIATPVSAVVGADLVVLATPVSSMESVLRKVAPHLAEGAIVTDVGSVKGVLSETLPGLLPEHATFIGSHPMAGSHLKGVEHARDDLFDDACCLVTPPDPVRREAFDRLCRFWLALGCRVLERSPAEHDLQAAWVSHAPHVLAFAFAHALGESPHAAGEMIGSGFRDFTRIARSDSELWGDILSANRKSLAPSLDSIARSLSELSRAIEGGDGEQVEQFLASARERLAAVESSVQSDALDPADSKTSRREAQPDPGGENPEITSAHKS